MLLHSDSFLVKRSTNELLKCNGYSITFNGLVHTLRLSAVDGNTYLVGPIESIDQLSNHVKSKAEWQTLYPEFLI